MELKHFSHEHPLVFTEDQSGRGSEVDRCSACEEPVSGRPSYCCAAKCKFYLHEACAELSLEITHSFHRQHPLTLVPNPREKSIYFCFLCRRDPRRFVYHCFSCKFTLDIKCALLPQLASGDFPQFQHFSHGHPLVIIEDFPGNQLETIRCDICCEPLLGCVCLCLDCWFCFHKKCGDELTPHINHSFHGKHRLQLVEKRPQFFSTFKEKDACKFCRISSPSRFFYECSPCHFKICAKCAFLPQFLTADLVEHEHITHQQHPLIFVEKHTNEIKGVNCCACSEKLSGSIYCCLDCGFFLHKKCGELDWSLEINHPCHRKHPLDLLTRPTFSHHSCNLCKKTCWGLVYHCTICKFQVDIQCVSPPAVVHEVEKHEHPFVLLSRQLSFICDACGTDGDYAPYLCIKCNLVVHKNCISLRRSLRIRRHEHPLSHIYFLQTKESKQWECGLCHDEVSTEHGSYYCKECNNYIAHVKCVEKDDFFYVVADDESEDKGHLETGEQLESCTIKESRQAKDKDVADAEILHFSHEHRLKLSQDEEFEEEKYCDGCMLSVSGSFYRCSQCNFFLHQTCAAFPEKKQDWGHPHRLTLRSDGIFSCTLCRYDCSGFAYSCNECNISFCLRCDAIPDQLKVEGHGEHGALIFNRHEWLHCSACGDHTRFTTYKCNVCNFNLDYPCVTRPETARYMFHDHPLKLTYHDVHEDPEQWFCLICEEKRDPNHWFYRCEECDYDAHAKCVLGKYPFIKRGSSYTSKTHLHPLTFFQNDGSYPRCDVCGKPCNDLGLKCFQSECDYICHWECEKWKR